MQELSTHARRLAAANTHVLLVTLMYCVPSGADKQDESAECVHRALSHYEDQPPGAKCALPPLAGIVLSRHYRSVTYSYKYYYYYYYYSWHYCYC